MNIEINDTKIEDLVRCYIVESITRYGLGSVNGELTTEVRNSLTGMITEAVRSTVADLAFRGELLQAIRAAILAGAAQKIQTALRNASIQVQLQAALAEAVRSVSAALCVAEEAERKTEKAVTLELFGGQT